MIEFVVWQKTCQMCLIKIIVEINIVNKMAKKTNINFFILQIH
jgi:hypothetical protein